MSFQGINFSSQHIVPSDDGRLYEAIFEDGALHGCELSYVGAALTIGAGYLMIGGREIEITEDEVFNINEATSGYAQLVLTIDLTQTATIGAFNQVSIDVRYASTEAGFASLIQDDINGAGTKYQQQLALVSLGTGGITGIVDGMPSASLKGAGRVFSIIAVTYPEGSICTCSDGTMTLTARDTSGKALFNVPNIGTWTVSCTDGTQTSSRTVNITDAGQVESVHIYFTVYLYNKGDEFTDITGGWDQYKDCGGTIIKENDNIALNLVGVANVNSIGYVITSNKIDLTKYKKLVINSDWVKSKSDTGHVIRFGVYSAQPATWSDVTNPVAGIGSGSNILDVSSISGEYYILVGAYMSGQTSYYADLSIKEVYME